MIADSKARKILRSFPKDVREYFVEIDNFCKKAKITFKISSGLALNSNGRCGGYFCNQTKTLAVAIGIKNLSKIIPLVEHERQHIRQFLNPRSIWYKKGIITGHARFSNYLSGHRIYKARECCMATLALELDCERKTIRALKRWSKYLDMSKTLRRTNSYLLSHWKMLETGKWPSKSCYDNKILAHCPDEFLKDYRKVPWRLKLAFDRYL